LQLKNAESEASTDASTISMKSIRDDIIGKKTKLLDRRDRVLGAVYSRTSDDHNRKFQVVHRTDKHINAILSLFSWMRQNLREFVDSRREMLSEREKSIFFNAMPNVAPSDINSIEMLQLTHTVKTKLYSEELTVHIQNDPTYTRNVADLVLVAISKNQQHVKAIAANSRSSTRTPKPSSSIDH